jgi:hypothetical protein
MGKYWGEMSVDALVLSNDPGNTATRYKIEQKEQQGSLMWYVI